MFISIPRLIAIPFVIYVYRKVLRALFRGEPDQSFKEERQSIEESSLFDFTEGFKMIYTMLNIYLTFIGELILLRKPIKNFGQALGLLLLSVVANKLGDLALAWALLFFVLIPPLLRTPDLNSKTEKSQLTFSERHRFLAKFIPLFEYLESKVPRFDPTSAVSKN